MGPLPRGLPWPLRQHGLTIVNGLMMGPSRVIALHYGQRRPRIGQKVPRAGLISFW